MDIHDDVVWLVSELEQQRYVEAGTESSDPLTPQSDDS